MQTETQQPKVRATQKTIHIIHLQLRPRERRAAVARDAARAELAAARENAWAGHDALARKATMWAEDATPGEELREERARVMQEDWGRLRRRR